MKPSRRHRIAQLLLWITPALWSSNYIIARASDGVIAPHALASGRWRCRCWPRRWPSKLGPTPRLAAITCGGVLVLLTFTALEAAFQPGPAFGAKALPLIVLAGLLPGFIAYQACAYMLRELGAARSSLVMYLATRKPAM